MAIPPLIDLPETACAASVVFGIRRVVANTQSPFTLEEQNFKWPGEMWTIDFSLPPIVSPAVAREWSAFGVKLKGSYGRFLIGDPLGRLPRGIATGTPLVNGSSQTGNLLQTKGWTPNVTGILLAGDYIQLGSGDGANLHMVVNNPNSNASGNATLELEPALRVSPADNAVIVTENARGVFRLISNTWSWQERPGKIYSISFQAQEVVNA